MAFEDDIEVPSSSNSSFYEFNDDCHDNNNDDDDDDGTYMVSNLMSKCKSLLPKKNHYKHKLTNLTKEFENLKNKLYLDSGCSRHMTGDKEQFNKLDTKMEDMLPLETMQKKKSLALEK